MKRDNGDGTSVLVLQRSMFARRLPGFSRPWPGLNLVAGTFTHPVVGSFGVWGLKSGQLVRYDWTAPRSLDAWQEWSDDILAVDPRSYQDGQGGYAFNSGMRAQFTRVNL
jgi:hypothetical protein